MRATHRSSASLVPDFWIGRAKIIPAKIYLNVKNNSVFSRLGLQRLEAKTKHKICLRQVSPFSQSQYSSVPYGTGCGLAAKAPASGAGDRRFKSAHPENMYCLQTGSTYFSVQTHSGAWPRKTDISDSTPALQASTVGLRPWAARIQNYASSNNPDLSTAR